MRYKGYVVTYATELQKVNKDNYLLNGICREDPEVLSFYEENKDFRRRNLYAVSSGAKCDVFGDELSLIAVDMLRGFLGMVFSEENRDYFALANAAMNSHVFEKPTGHFEVDTSVLCIESDVATVFNMGDAPVFYFEKGKLRKLSGKAPETVEIEKNTFDDSGTLKTEVIVKENITYMCSPAEDCETVPYTSESIKLKHKAYFLLCSKAVCDAVDETEISRILSDKKIKSKDKAARIIDAAIEKNPNGNYTAEVVAVERGLSITDADVRALGIWMAVAAVGALIYFVTPYITKAVSDMVDNGKEFVGERFNEEDEQPDEGLKWIPKKTEEPEKEPETKPEEIDEQKEEAPQQQTTTDQPSRPVVQPAKPQASQNQTPAVEQQKPVEVPKPEPEPETVAPLPEASALPEINEEVELPIDFN